jgi:hypothetical protein
MIQVADHREVKGFLKGQLMKTDQNCSLNKEVLIIKIKLLKISLKFLVADCQNLWAQLWGDEKKS